MIGYIAIAVASVMWSLNPAVISRFREHIKPVTFTALRALAALALLYPLAAGRFELRDSSSYALAIIVLSAVVGPGIGDALYTKSVQILGGSLAVVLGYTYIFVAQILAVLLLGEELTLGVAVGTVLAFSGVVLAVGPKASRSGVSVAGVAYAFGAAISWGVATVMIGLALQFAGTLTLTVVRLATVLALFLPLGLLTEGLPPRESLKPLLVASAVTGLLGWGIGMYLFVLSIGLIGVAVTSTATALTPVLSQLTTKLVAGERVRANTVLGAVLTSIGIVVTTESPVL